MRKRLALVLVGALMSVAVAAKEILPFIWKSITRTGFDTGFALTLAL